MKSQGSKKATRIFVARIPQSVDESMFRRHFEAYGEITDLYMPKVSKFGIIFKLLKIFMYSL
jgi:RNA-binding protein Musashi